MHTPLNNFTRHLAHETGLMRAFLAILGEEARSLHPPVNVDALRAAVARKQEAASQLQAAATARATHLTSLGFADVQHDFSPVVQQYPQLGRAIDELVELAAQARARNVENGELIQTWQRRDHDALTALQTLTGARENPTRLYDARGRSKPAGKPGTKTYVTAG